MQNHWIMIGMGFLFLIHSSGAAIAQHGHGGHPSPPQKSSPLVAPKAIPSATVEGWKIVMEVMNMEEHMKHLKGSSGHGAAHHSQSHSLMVTVQDTFSKEIVSDAKVKFTILSPSGKKESGTMEWSGDHYGGGFSPREKGKYQIHLLMDGGGLQREAKFTYEAK